MVHVVANSLHILFYLRQISLIFVVLYFTDSFMFEAGYEGIVHATVHGFHPIVAYSVGNLDRSRSLSSTDSI